MSLYENWMTSAFSKEGRSIDAVWDEYLPKEQKVYEEILENKIEKLSGTIKELAAKYGFTLEEAVGFVDGINDVLPQPYDMMSIDENTQVELNIDFEKLYKKMVAYKAEHLFNLPQWNNIFTEAERKKFFIEQRDSRTIVKGDKIGRNDPCPCGSGKKYKKCCGANK